MPRIIYLNGIGYAVKDKAFSVSTINANEIVAAVTGKRIVVLYWKLSSSGTVNAKWQSGSTDLTGLDYLVANSAPAVAFNPVGHFATAAGEALNLHLSAGSVPVGGYLNYIEV